MPENFSTQQVADLYGVEVWRIQRLFSVGALPDVPRFAGKRMVPRSMLPTVVDALRARGWLPAEAVTS